MAHLRLGPTLAGLALVTLALALLGLLQGAIVVPLRDLVLQATPDARLVLQLRGPRVVTALLAGSGLAGAGAALQIIFRNPLVAPDLLGVSTGAALGAVIGLLLGLSPVLVQGSALLGGLSAAATALLCASAARSSEPGLALVLCGIVTGALASAGVALALFLADPYAELPALTFWLLGSFARANATDLPGALLPVMMGLGGLLWLGFRLDALALGDAQARALGLPARAIRFAAIGSATLVTAAITALTGVVGWIGLLAPHAARQLVGEDAQRLLPAAMLIGAGFALLLDLAGRILGPVEIPVGLLAAAIGAPMFLAIFLLSDRAA